MNNLTITLHLTKWELIPIKSIVGTRGVNIKFLFIELNYFNNKQPR